MQVFFEKKLRMQFFDLQVQWPLRKLWLQGLMGIKTIFLMSGMF